MNLLRRFEGNPTPPCGLRPGKKYPCTSQCGAATLSAWTAKYRSRPLRLRFTLFPGAVQYAQAEKLGMENMLLGNCPCMK